MTLSVVVIGAGIGGLQTAILLAQSRPDARITVVEASSRAGGRLRTEYKKEKVLFETGPWRVHDEHVNTLALIRRYGLDLQELSSSVTGSMRKAPRAPRANPAVPRDDPSFSVWDRDAIEAGGPIAADKIAYSKGYGVKHRQEAVGGNSYRVKDTTKRTRFWVLKNGFSALIEKMVQELSTHDNVTLLLNHRVVDVVPSKSNSQGSSYTVRCKRRDGHNAFSDVSIRCRRVCISAPPHSCRNWGSIKKELDLAWSGIDTVPLMHIYASIPKKQLRRICPNIGEGFHIIHNGLCQQLISGEKTGRADPDLIQVAYAGGNCAETLERLRLSDPAQLARVVAQDVVTALGGEPSNVSHIMDTLMKRDNIKCCYFPHAVHQWLPSYSQSLKNNLILSTTCIDPCRLPGLVASGEAFSLQQGWCEGALVSAEKASKELSSEGFILDRMNRRPLPSKYVLFKDWVIDVKKWSSVHPGSSGAILNHLKEEVSFLFHHIGHSSDALRILAGLRCGIHRNGDMLTWHGRM